MRKTDNWLMWVSSAAHSAVVLGEERCRSLLRSDPALSFAAGTATLRGQQHGYGTAQVTGHGPVEQDHDLDTPVHQLQHQVGCGGCSDSPPWQQEPPDHAPIASVPRCSLHVTYTRVESQTKAGHKGFSDPGADYGMDTSHCGVLRSRVPSVPEALTGLLKLGNCQMKYAN
ncbi:hypothetical protein llap_8452 [Limosa lapponica baueri]|uniref:Uncharacterized protein n=1 Tax=Limosa lapponica baueri TaxID=1758121 RepID=A0A2I0U596_LIMLA|nr:hypothetical protein llap_8452 [Limosa lapponica baueri]